MERGGVEGRNKKTGEHDHTKRLWVPYNIMSTDLPREFLDAHHHFIDTRNNKFQSFLRSLVGPNAQYLAKDYQRDVIQPLSRAGVTVLGSVHVECMPDNGYEEAKWVDDMIKSGTADVLVSAIVASCDLASPTVEAELKKLKEVSPRVKGIRWILDCVGPYKPNTATHVGTSRHDGIDYLRGSQGGYSGETVREFEEGFALLSKYGFSFDLQCAPAQLVQAAALCARHPSVPVVIDHLGKPRMLLGKDDESNTNTRPEEEELAQWRKGMKRMAELPHVYAKISMLGYAVPGWIRTPERTGLLKQLVQETVELFGPNRCMVALNWWKDGATSDADGMSDVGPDPVQFLRHMSSFFDGYSEADRQRLFVETAREFYGM